MIPTFQFLSAELRQIRVKGYTTEGEEKTYDMFMRNDPSLCRAYPAWIVAKDVTVIQVRSYVSVPCCRVVFSAFVSLSV